MAVVHVIGGWVRVLRVCSKYTSFTWNGVEREVKLFEVMTWYLLWEIDWRASSI